MFLIPLLPGVSKIQSPKGTKKYYIFLKLRHFMCINLYVSSFVYPCVNLNRKFNKLSTNYAMWPQLIFTLLCLHKNFFF